MARTRRRGAPTAAAVTLPRRPVGHARAVPAIQPRRQTLAGGWPAPAALVELGLLVVVITVPLLFSRFSSESFELPKTIALRIALFVTACAAAVAFVVRWPADARIVTRLRSRAGLRKWLVDEAAWPALAVTAAVVGAWALAAALSVAPSVSWWGVPFKWAGVRTQVGYVGAFFFAALAISALRAARRLVIAAVAAGVISAAYGVLQWLRLDPFQWSWSTLGEANDAWTRPASTYGNPNYFGGLLAMSLCLTAAGAVAAKERTRRWLWIAAAGLQGVALLLTQSRSAWVATVAGLATFVLLIAATRGALSRRTVVLLVGGLVAAGVALWLIAPHLPRSGILGRVATLARPTEGSGGTRLLVWGASWRLWLARPLVGYGPDAFSTVIQRAYDPPLVRVSGAAVADRAENATFDALVAAGIVGVAALLFAIGVVVWHAWHLVSHRRAVRLETDPASAVAGSNLRRVQPFAAGMVAALLAHLVADHLTPESPAASTMAWLLAGAVVALGRSAWLAARGADVAAGVSFAPARRDGAVPRVLPPLAVWVACAAAGLAAVAFAWWELLPLRASMAYDAGLQLQRASRQQDAIGPLAAAAALAPNNPQHWLTLGGATREAARARGAAGKPLYLQALAAMDQALVRSPSNPLILSTWGSTASEVASVTGDTALAARGLSAQQRAIELTPQFWRYVATAAETEMALGRPATAKDYYARAAALNAGDWLLWVSFGDAALNSGDQTAARAAYRGAEGICQHPPPAGRQCKDTDLAVIQRQLAQLGG